MTRRRHVGFRSARPRDVSGPDRCRPQDSWVPADPRSHDGAGRDDACAGHDLSRKHDLFRRDDLPRTDDLSRKDDRRWSGRASGDRGSATVIVLALSAVVLLLGGLLAAVGSAAIARHRAAAAADLAALAAAAALARGEDACGQAAEVAGLQGAAVRSCTISGPAVEVVVGLRPAGQLAAFGGARARARAGPAQGEPSGEPAQAGGPA